MKGRHRRFFRRAEAVFLAAVLMAMGMAGGIARKPEHAAAGARDFEYTDEAGIVYTCNPITHLCVVKDCNTQITEAVVPSALVVDGAAYTVTEIGENAFANCDFLEMVNLPEGIVRIGKDAFCVCNRLESVVLPDSLMEIGFGAFQGCRSLTDILIPKGVNSIETHIFYSCVNLRTIRVAEDNPIYDSRDGCNAIIETDADKLIISCVNTTIPMDVTAIGEYAFAGSDIKSLVIPAHIEKINRYAFSGCTQLKELTISNGVKMLGYGAFYHCEELKRIEIPDSVADIEPDICSGCWKLDEIIVSDGNSRYDSRGGCNAVIETDTNILIAACRKTTIPDGIKTISECAFRDCRGLQELAIPSSVRLIERSAFVGCYDLKEVVIPEGVVQVKQGAFGSMGVRKLCIPASLVDIAWGENGAFDSEFYIEEITASEDNPIYDSRDHCNALIETETDTLLLGSKNTIIPDTVKHIGERAFLNNSVLTDFMIPENVTSIGKKAFYHCNNLLNVVISSGVKEIHESAFEACPNLVIYCEKDSEAERYAKEKGIRYSIMNQPVISQPPPAPSEGAGISPVPTAIGSIQESQPPEMATTSPSLLPTPTPIILLPTPSAADVPPLTTLEPSASPEAPSVPPLTTPEPSASPEAPSVPPLTTPEPSASPEAPSVPPLTTPEPSASAEAPSSPAVSSSTPPSGDVPALPSEIPSGQPLPEASDGMAASAAAVSGKRLSVSGVAVQVTAKLFVLVRWKRTPSASGYEIWRGTEKGGALRKVKTVKAGRTRFTDKTVKRGKTYYYRLVPCVPSVGHYDIRESSVVSVSLPWYIRPKIRLKKGRNMQGEKYVEVSLERYQGKYADIYVKRGRKGRYLKLAFPRKEIASYHKKYKFQYRSEHLTLYFKARTFGRVKGRRAYSDYSDARKIAL